MPLLTLPDAGSLSLSVRAKALVFEDPRSEQLLGRIRQVAPSHATVLVTGETGTGKELVARHVHELSRPDRPFLAVNCGAFSETLIESELFGHEKGAFTGAHSAKPGWFESAHHGTLFLDEIGDLSLSAQVKLLRVLQENEVVRLGSRHPTPVDVRLIAATNVGLEEAVQAGHFREDLFYRLNVAPLALSPLRDRPGDILPLARHFLQIYRQRLGSGPTALTESAERRLLEHRWPGNIRELENVIHHALLICQSALITPEDLRLSTLQPRSLGSVPPPALGSAPPPAQPLPPTLENALLGLFEQNVPDLYARVERALIQEAYRYCDRNQLQTARLLGISRNIVRARLIQYGELVGTPRSSGSRASDDAEAPNSSRRPTPWALRSSTERPLVTIGFQKLGLLPILKARGTLEAALARRGFALSWVEYPGGTQLVEAFESGEVSLGVVGEGPAVLAQAAPVPIVYLAAEAPAPEGEGIVVPSASSIGSVRDLAGKRVGLNRGSNAHYLLIRALEEVGLACDDVELCFLPPEQASLAFGRGDLDAWAIWDPLLAEAERSLGAHLLRDARHLASNPVYHIASREFSESHPSAVSAFLDELAVTAAWVPSRTQREVAELAPKVGVSPAALEISLARSPGRRLLDKALIASQQEVADTFFKLNLIARPLTISEAAWPVLRTEAFAADGELLSG